MSVTFYQKIENLFPFKLNSIKFSFFSERNHSFSSHMKRFRPPLGHINKIGISPPTYQFRRQPHQIRQQQPLLPTQPDHEKQIKQISTAQLPPLTNNTKPQTARVRYRPTNLPIPDTSSKNLETIPQNINNQNCTTEKSEAKTPEYVLNTMSHLLFDFEKIEILNYSEIYYVRQASPKMRVHNPIIPNFFQFIQNDHIAYRYQQLELMGKGAFGSVIRCLDHKSGKRVAIKLIRDQQKYHDQTRLERDILKNLQTCSRIARFLKSFTFRGFFCIVTELLYKDSYSVLRNQHYCGFHINQIRMISKQLAEALFCCHKNQIIHCDIKPENILFTNKRQIAVKLVDFGCSCYFNKTHFTYIQSRYFRAPEVVLGLPYGPEIDVWSYACVLVELYTGRPLFPAPSERDLLEMMIKYIGFPPKEFITGAKRADKYFDSEGKMKPIQQTSYSKKNNNNKVIPFSLNFENLLNCNMGPNQDPNNEICLLCDMIKKCLRWCPNQRLTMEAILSHPFMTLNDSNLNNSVLPPLTYR